MAREWKAALKRTHSKRWRAVQKPDAWPGRLETSPLPHAPGFEKPQFFRPMLALFLAHVRIGQQAPKVRRPSPLLALTRGRQSALNGPARGAWREGGGKEALSDASGRWAERGSPPLANHKTPSR